MCRVFKGNNFTSYEGKTTEITLGYAMWLFLIVVFCAAASLFQNRPPTGYVQLGRLAAENIVDQLVYLMF